jgi:hypothetical protein
MSSVHRYQSRWRDVVFNRVYDDSGITDDPVHMVEAYQNSDFRLDSFDATRVESQDYRELRQWLEGAEANEAYEGVLIGIGSGIIIGSTIADLEDKTQLLRASFSIANSRLAAAESDPVGVLPFDFRRATMLSPGYLDLRMYARPAAARPVVIPRKLEGLSRRFRWSLVSFDPRFYSQAEVTTAVPTKDVNYSIVNEGDAYTSPEIVITGGATIALYINGTEVVVFSSLPAGPWTIDASRSTITKADGSNGYAYRTSGYISNLRLMPGHNTFGYGGAGGGPLTVRHRHAYA